MLMSVGIRVAALAIASLLIAARPAAAPLHGVYQSDCAPNDGPAFIIILPAPVPQGEFWLRANVPVARIAGHWPQSKNIGRQPGMASILLCRKTPGPPGLSCDRPEAGFFSVTGRPGESISGTLQASFGNGVRHTHRFSAVPARLAQPVICG
jgi:hypothetical protein